MAVLCFFLVRLSISIKLNSGIEREYMYNKVLIANRGEIALRVMRACKELGIKTVAVYSEADKEALHVKYADGAVCIGPARSTDSYLNMISLMSTMEVVDAEAVHPGYGFLAENSAFAEVCEKSGIKFIGPKSQLMRTMGNKIGAKREAEAADVPVLPWSNGPVETEEQALQVAEEIGYPVLIKASNGGGGRGMKVVHTKAALPHAFHVTKTEAGSAFGSDEVFIERLALEPSHIEIQIMADEHGNVVHLGERECSIQRRHQKILEEAPSVQVDADLRRRMGEASIRLAKRIGYTNAGTIEYLLDRDGNFYFMEMNTRVQVEHPVTEEVTGFDIVKEQIRVAYGEKLSVKQSDIVMKGHSIECRINAEDPDNFTPSPGKITELCVPGGRGVRVDSAMYCNYFVPSYYDNLLAKLIVHGETREEAIRKMAIALDEFHVGGIKTNIKLHRKILDDHDFIDGNVNIDFLSKYS